MSADREKDLLLFAIATAFRTASIAHGIDMGQHDSFAKATEQLNEAESMGLKIFPERTAP